MEARVALIKALIEFQKEFQGLRPDSTNPYFNSKYISLDGILETVRPLLAKHGLAVIQEVTADGDRAAVRTILVHEGGHQYETDWLRMAPLKKQPKGYTGPEETSKDPQSMGSAITYAKRYQLGALLGVCESADDDANQSTGRPQQTQKQQDAPKPPQLPVGWASVDEQTKALGELKERTIAKGYPAQKGRDFLNLTKLFLGQEIPFKDLTKVQVQVLLKAIEQPREDQDAESGGNVSA